MRDIDPVTVAMQLVIIFFAIGLHEYAHAKFADMAGDPTPRMQGRVTLNLFKHFDPLGTVMIVLTSIFGFGIGWGKPVQVNPARMHNPRWDHFVSVAAGPLANLIQATFFGVILRFTGVQGDLLPLFLKLGILINLSLCFFNLLPIGPLDGHWLVGAFLPDHLRYSWYQFNHGVGTSLLLMIILLGQFTHTSILFTILSPFVNTTFRLITGFNISPYG